MKITKFDLQWKHWKNVKETDRVKLLKMTKIAANIENMPLDIIQRLEELVNQEDTFTNEEFAAISEAFSYAPNLIALGIHYSRTGIFYEAGLVDETMRPDLNEQQLYRIFDSIKSTIAFDGEIIVEGEGLNSVRRCIINKSTPLITNAIGYRWEGEQ